MTRTMRTLAFTAALAAAALAPSAAQANGRFPESNKVVVGAGDPSTVYLRVTFGLLQSRDGGHTWDWICEQSVGFSGNEDPMYAATPNGTVLATTLLGVTVSHDRGCSFAFAGGDLSGKLFVDLAQRPDDPRSVVALSSAYQGKDDAGGIAFDSQLWETKDEGVSFVKLGPPIDPYLFPQTLDVTKSDPLRVYVSGVRDPSGAPSGVVLVSQDGAQTFSPVSVKLEGTEDGLYIAGVDPTNASRFYLRTSAKNDAPTRLLVTDDAGSTFRTAYQAKGALQGFALSPDGTRVWIGGPKDGLLVASTADLAFTQKATFRVQCLTSTTEGLWACSDENTGFVAGFSTDDGATFEPRLRFCQIRGPLACDPGTSTHTQCTLGSAATLGPPWPAQYRSLGCAGDAGAEGGGGAPPEDDGCACRTPPAAPSQGWASPTLLAIATAAVVGAWRRRTRR